MNEYKIYTGEYEKQHYDVKCFNGDEHESCWPNAGNFYAFDGTRIFGKDVAEIKICDIHPLRRYYKD